MAILFHDITYYIFPLILTDVVLTFVSFPFSTLFFSRLSDKGISISRVLGLFFVSFLTFNISTVLSVLKFEEHTHVPALGLWTVYFSLAIWTLFNLLLIRTTKPFKNFSIRMYLGTELLFISLVSIWYVIWSHGPELYQIERFMDYGFIQALFNARSLPLFDIWYWGKPVNYYYFGHFLAFVFLSLAHIKPLAGYIVCVLWLASATGMVGFIFSQSFFHSLTERAQGTVRKRLFTISSLVAGVTGLFLFTFAGNLDQLLWLVPYIRDLFTHHTSAYFWYADVSRMIKGTITEPPIYTFLEAEMHAHAWGLLVGSTVLSLLLMIWVDVGSKVSFKNKYLWLLMILLGIAMMTNSWDVLSLGILSAVILIVKYKEDIVALSLTAVSTGVALLCTFLLSIYSWFVFFSSPVRSFGLVESPSPVHSWILFWGGFFFLSLLILFVTGFEHKANIISFKFTKENGFFLLVFNVCLFFWLFMETFYVKDILSTTDWTRANTVFKLTSQLWTWLSLTLAGSFGLVLYKMGQGTKYKVVAALFVLYIFISGTYTFKAVAQAKFAGHTYTGIGTGLDWMRDRYKGDYEALQYLLSVRDSLPSSDKVRVIVEASGESYEDNNYFSVFLGWRSIIGWPVHEWTWRGSYQYVGPLRNDVNEIYTGESLDNAVALLNKYDADYIVIGAAEKRVYGNSLKEEKLLKTGKVVFDKDGTKIIQFARL